MNRVDRFGNNISIGWTPTEHEWIVAALTLCQADRELAFGDIAAMTGRRKDLVRSYAYKILNDRLERQVQENAKHNKSSHAAMLERRKIADERRRMLGPSLFAPSKEQLMRGK